MSCLNVLLTFLSYHVIILSDPAVDPSSWRVPLQLCKDCFTHDVSSSVLIINGKASSLCAILHKSGCCVELRSKQCRARVVAGQSSRPVDKTGDLSHIIRAHFYRP
jgi:hypothetical protein